MLNSSTCPGCGEVLPRRNGKLVKFCPRCGLSGESSDSKIQTLSPVSTNAQLVPITRQSVAEDSFATESRWNAGAWSANWLWLFMHRAVGLGVVYLILNLIPVAIALVSAGRFFQSQGRDYAALSLAPIVLLLGGIFVLLMAIPVALRGDRIALGTGRFATAYEFRRSRRRWTAFGLIIVLINGLVWSSAFFLVVQASRHSPEGLNARLQAASVQGDLAEIRNVLSENTEKMGIGASNLDLDNAITNAQFGNHSEAVNLLQSEKARRQRGAGGEQ